MRWTNRSVKTKIERHWIKLQFKIEYNLLKKTIPSKMSWSRRFERFSTKVTIETRRKTHKCLNEKWNKRLVQWVDRCNNVGHDFTSVVNYFTRVMFFYAIICNYKLLFRVINVRTTAALLCFTSLTSHITLAV